MVGIATNTTFRVVLLTPRAKVLDCRAGVAVIPCTDGLWGILRGHCPLLTGLSQGIMQVRGIPDRADAFYILERGFARFSEDHLTVLAYDVITFEGLDPEKVKQMVSHARDLAMNKDFITTELKRLEVNRNRCIVQMAEMAALSTPGI
jgi:F-type H+-transporting ATPase subunit epsilon